MNFLNVFEHRVGSLFGATAQGLTAPFSFKKLAKKAAREMEAETFVIDGVDTAPALYTILVSSEDDLAMRPLYAQLTNETAQFVEGQAQNKGYVFIGRPLVRFMADPSLRSGRFSVFAENVDAQTLNRLREEEAKFMGAEPAGIQPAGQQAGLNPIPQPQVRPSVDLSPQLSDNPMSGMDAGLDVLPQETVLDAEEAALGAAARRNQNVPLVNSRQQQVPTPVAPERNPLPPVVQQRAVAPEPAAAAPAHHVSARRVPAMPDLSPVAEAGVAIVAEQASTPEAHAAAGAAAASPIASALPGFDTPQQAAPQPQDPAPQPARQQAAPAPQQAVPTPRTVRAPQPVPAPAAAAPATCLLIDRQSGRTYTASSPRTVIGRERTPGGVVLHDPNVSRTHAELSFDGQGWRIRDLNSTNGTLVNDVDVDECPLRDGDLITLGLVNLEFREN